MPYIHWVDMQNTACITWKMLEYSDDILYAPQIILDKTKSSKIKNRARRKAFRISSNFCPE